MDPIHGYTHKDWGKKDAPLASFTWIQSSHGTSKMPLLFTEDDARKRFGWKNIIAIQIVITEGDYTWPT